MVVGPSLFIKEASSRAATQETAQGGCSVEDELKKKGAAGPATPSDSLDPHAGYCNLLDLILFLTLYFHTSVTAVTSSRSGVSACQLSAP